MKPNINSIHWYENKYSEDWAEIIRDEDIRLGRNSDGSYPMFNSKEMRELYNKPTSWASDGINN